MLLIDLLKLNNAKNIPSATPAIADSNCAVIIGDSEETSPALRQLQQQFASIIFQHTSLDLYFSQGSANPSWAGDVIKTNRFHLLPCQGSSCLWPRDWGIKFQQTFWRLLPPAVDLPLTTAPKTPLSQLEIKNLIANSSAPFWPRGDLGGNMMAFTASLWAVGDSASEELMKQMTAQFNLTHPPLKLTTAWTMIGHLDELWAFLAPKNASENSYLFYADPLQGLALFKQMTPQARKELLQSINPSPERSAGLDLGMMLENEQRQDFAAAVDLKHAAFKALAQANQTYAAMIQNDLKKIETYLAQTPNRPPSLVKIALPILWIPAFIQDAYGLESDNAISAGANSVNFWHGENIIITAKWPWQNWQMAIERQMQKYPGKVFYLDTQVLHQRRGGLHCFTNEL